LALRIDVTLLEENGENGIVAVRKDVTLLEEEWGNGYSGGT